MSIQRWALNAWRLEAMRHPNGEWVLWSDHVAEVERLTRDVTNAMDAVAELERDLAAARAERDGLAKALREIRDQDWMENTLDPQWSGRIACAALAALPTPPKEDA